MRARRLTLSLSLLTGACPVPAEPSAPADTGATAVDTAPPPDTDPPVAPPDTDDGTLDRPLAPARTEVLRPASVCSTPTDRDQSWYRTTALSLGPTDPTNTLNLVGGGIAIEDVDGDGHLDVIAAGTKSAATFLGNGAGTLTPAKGWLDRLPLDDATSLVPTDLDDDGDQDLIVTRWDRTPLALRNDGAPPLVDVSAEYGLDALPAAKWIGAALGDLDADGDLDLFLAAYGPRPEDAYADVSAFEDGEPSMVLRRTPDGFVDAGLTLPSQVTEAHTFGGAWVDVDGDARPELVVINDFGWARASQLLWNRSGVLVPDDGSAGFAIPFAGMGLGIGDVNGDLRPDWVQSSWSETSLLVSRADTTGAVKWFDEAQSKALWPVLGEGIGQFFGWGTVLTDLDVDGDLDVAIGYGFWRDWEGFNQQPDGLFLRQADGTYQDQAERWGFDDPNPARGVATGDLNEDGYPDLVVRHLRYGITAYLSRCGTGQAVELRLAQPGRPNVDAVGARVEIDVNGTTLVRWVVNGSHNLFGSDPHALHVGFGVAPDTVPMRVTWPDGARSELSAVPTRGAIRIVRTAEE